MFVTGLTKVSSALHRDAAGVLGGVAGGTLGLLAARRATQHKRSELAMPVSGMVGSLLGNVGGRRLYALLKASRKR